MLSLTFGISRGNPVSAQLPESVIGDKLMAISTEELTVLKRLTVRYAGDFSSATRATIEMARHRLEAELTRRAG